MGRMDGKVAFITGAARGQGRSHALRLAEEGAEIIAVDLCRPVETVPYEMPTPDDLAETAKLVEELDRRIVARQADVRDLGQLQAVVQEGISEFGHIDVVCANAGIGSVAPAMEMDEQTWQEMIDINLTGVWKTIKAAVAPMIERRQGGAVIITSSVAGLMGFPNLAHYVAAKHGVVGTHAGARPGAGALHDPGQHREPDHRRHPDGHVGRSSTGSSDPTSRTRAAKTWARPSPASTRCRSRGSTRSTSATPCCGWRPTRPATSRASRCPSTPASARRSAGRRLVLPDA